MGCGRAAGRGIARQSHATSFLEMAARFREDDDETTSLSDLLKEQDIKL